MQPPALPNQRDNDGAKDGIPDGGPNLRSDRRQLNRVALIGASVRAAAQSAARAGLEVVGIDRFGDQDTLQACQSHLSIGPAVADEKSQTEDLRVRIATIAKAVPIIPVGGLVDDDRNWLDPDSVLKPWPSQRAAVEKVRELDLLCQIVAGTPFSVPPTIPHLVPPTNQPISHSVPPTISYLVPPTNQPIPYLVPPTNQPPTNQSSVFSSHKTRWLRKNIGASGGLGIRWFESNSHPPSEPTDVIQQWVEGRPFGATLLSNGTDSMLLGVCRSLYSRKGPFPFVYCGSLGPVEIRDSTWESLADVGQRLVAATGLRGLFNIDYVEHPDGSLWLLEINPRWSGSSELIERHLRRLDDTTSLMALMLGGLNASPLDRRLAANAKTSKEEAIYLKRIVFARRDLRFDLSGILCELHEQESVHDLPLNGQLIRSGEPICTLLTCIASHEKNPMRRHRVLVNAVSNHHRVSR